MTMSPRTQAAVAVLVSLLAIDCTGALLLTLLLLFVVPLPAEFSAAEIQGTLMLSAGYSALGSMAGLMIVRRTLVPVIEWLQGDAAPPASLQRRVVEAPGTFATWTGLLWLGGAVVAGVGNLDLGPVAALAVAVTFALGALGASSVTYLVAERLLRPWATRVVSASDEIVARGRVSNRLVFTWLLTSGTSMLAVALTTVLALGVGSSQRDLAFSVLALTLLGATGGGVTTYLAARAVATPIEQIRRALADVERGDLGVRVPVWDGTELGLLQAGFNRATAGLEDRERIRDVFGRHVGPEVAARALAADPDFAGETRLVAALFVDIADSTRLAEEVPAAEVISVLNRFFDVVVNTVEAEGGWVNKFVGDAALVVWGAPLHDAQAATRSLRATRALARRLKDELPEIRAGIGLSWGSAVAGNVGAVSRYEYTTIGDPVNEAARLTDLAKSVPGGALVNARLLDAAAPEEREHWVLRDPVVVRGRTSQTRVAALR